MKKRRYARGRRSRRDLPDEVVLEIGDLPDEVLIDHIFMRLSIKSLVRCRSVCKAWNRFIRDPQFVRQHLDQQQHSPKLLIKVPNSKTFNSVDYEEAIGRVAASADAVKLYLPPEASACYDSVLLGCCNGLVSMAFYENGSTKLILWNPSTRESKFIPDPNPCINHYSDITGFYYDSTVDDYKIMRIIHTRVTCRIDMYSVRNSSWKMLRHGPAPNGIDFKPSSHTQLKWFEVNGFIYWLLFSDYSDIPNSSIIEFGLRDNNFTQLPMPHEEEPTSRNATTNEVTERNLRVLGRCHLAAYYFYENEKFVVWTMKKEEEERKWEKLISLCISSPDYAFTLSMRPVWFTKDGKVLLILGFPHQQKFGLYDPQKKSIEYVQINGVESCYFWEKTYYETLVSPHTGC